MISAIIPARNAADTIVRTLDSLVCDRDLFCEVLLVDDGSDDDTARIAVGAARERNLPLTVKSGRFGGAGAARNAGIAEAQGKYIYFIDADDEMGPGGLRLLHDALVRDPAAGIAIGASVRRSAGRSDKRKIPSGFGVDPRNNAVKLLRNETSLISMGSALIVAEQVADVRFPETINLDEDTCYWAAVLTRMPVTTIADEVLLYNHDEERMTQRFVSFPRKYLVDVSMELNRLEAYGIDKAALQWRKAWIAQRIVRLLIKRKGYREAASIMRMARAHPEFRGGWKANKYRTRIAVGRAVQYFGFRKPGRKAQSDSMPT
jgi:O-antigen biosynthesis protein